MKEEKRCHNCKFFATKDEGYSNYTVTETYIHCLKNLNKSFPMEESYSWVTERLASEHTIMKVAETCDGYKYGEQKDQISLDVEGEMTVEDWKEDEELYNVAKNYHEF